MGLAGECGAVRGSPLGYAVAHPIWNYYWYHLYLPEQTIPLFLVWTDRAWRGRLIFPIHHVGAYIGESVGIVKYHPPQ